MPEKRSFQVSVVLCVFVLVIFVNSAALADIIGVPSDVSSIQGAIEAAKDYDTILVSPGTYTESLNYLGKAIIVKSSDGPLSTIITNSPSVTLVVCNSGETTDAVLEGFTLEGGWIGIYCENSALTIRDNILRDQNVTDWAAISIGGPGYPSATAGPAPAVIVNNTIVNCANGGISTFSSEAPTIKNNIIAFNTHYAIHRQGPSYPHPIMSYNCTYGNMVDFQNISELGDGHLFLNPQFNTDYSLQASSPCIDAGDPDPAYNDPDGTRSDIGAVYFEGGGVTHDPGIIYVPADFATIQDAVNYAVNGDTIMVSAGEYAENVDFIGKDIILVSASGAESTSIVSPYSTALWSIASDYDSTANTVDTVNYMMMAEQGASTEVLNIAGTSRSTKISGFTIDGAGLVRGVYGMQSSAEISDCIIQNCVGPYDAGAVFFERGAPLIKDNLFRNNMTPISGAAVFIRLGYGYGTAEIVGNTMHDNVSGNGPAVSLIEGDDAIVDHNLCYNNIGTEGSTRKGSIYFRGYNIVVTNNTCVGNTMGMTVLMTDNCDVRNNIAVDNVEYGIEVRNNEYPQNTNFTYDYNDVWGNGYGQYWQVGMAAHDITADPLFNSDYSLQDGSPCINAGDPDPAYNDPDGSRNDMGAIPYTQSENVYLFIEPNEFSIVQINPVGEATAAIYLADGFMEGYSLTDIETSSIIINDDIVPQSVTISGHPDYPGDFLVIVIDLPEFVESYGILWGVSTELFSVSGQFTDESEFTESAPATFIGHTPGDVNADSNVNMIDIVYVLNYVYSGGPAPIPIPEVADVNGTGDLNILDIIYYIKFLYNGGDPLQHP